MEAEYSCTAEKAGSKYSVCAGKNGLEAKTKLSKSDDVSQKFAVGSFKVEKLGTIEIALSVESPDATNLFGLAVTQE